MSDVRIKICGLTTPEDARIAADLGADYFGMILSQGFKRSILPSRAVDIELAVDARLVGVFVDESVSEVERICGMIGTSVIQLHGEEERDYVEELRRRGDWAIWKAIRVRDRATAIHAVRAWGPSVDGVLLDGWHESYPGGGGVSFSWDEMRSVRVEIPEGVDLIAAGGLRPANVASAVDTLRPDVVDVSSGVELQVGRKDPDLIRSFIRNARAGESSAPVEDSVEDVQ